MVAIIKTVRILPSAPKTAHGLQALKVVRITKRK